MNTVSDFISHHYRHFNAASLKDAAQGYRTHLEKEGKMLVTVAGAMSTAEIGLSLAEMIRQDKIHAICCTGANLEEDVFNLVAHDHYKRIPKWRELKGEKMFPHEFFYSILRDDRLKKSYQIDPKHSWLHAATQKNLPMFVPGWED